MTQTVLLTFVALGVLSYLLVVATAASRLVVAQALADFEIVFALVGVVNWLAVAFGATSYELVTQSGVRMVQSSEALTLVALGFAGLGFMVAVFGTTRLINPYETGEGMPLSGRR